MLTETYYTIIKKCLNKLIKEAEYNNINPLNSLMFDSQVAKEFH